MDQEAKSALTDFWKMKNVYAKHAPVDLTRNSKRRKKRDILAILIRRDKHGR